MKDKFAETKAKTMNEISLSLLKYAAINDDHADYTTAKEMKKAKTSNKHRAPWLGNDERSVFFFFFFLLDVTEKTGSRCVFVVDICIYSLYRYL